MQAGNIAIVGGTGFEQLPPEIFAESLKVDTRFGKSHVLSVSDNYVEPYKLFFLSRHGAEHGLAPHQINYRANIAALQELDVRYVYATNAVGSLRIDLLPGALVLLDDFIDFTRQRDTTFFDDNDWKHTDFSIPYSPRMRDAVLKSAEGMRVSVTRNGTYVCCDGPRFESPAEVRLFRMWGGDVVGMTGLPEAIFASEAGMEYSGLGIVTNLGAGLSNQIVDHQEVVSVMASTVATVRHMLITASGILIETMREEK